MVVLALKVLLTLYIAYALLKFFDFFYQSYDRRILSIRAAYDNNGRILRIFDNVVLVFMLILVVLLLAAGAEYLSFTTGLLVGCTLIQIYFHRFSEPLPADKAPEPPVSAIKLMSWSIQASPAKPWRELAILTVLFLWAVIRLWTDGLA